MAEMPADQFAEWQAFFTLEPTDWPALNMVATRLSWLMVQLQARKRLREDDYVLRPASNVHSEAAERARLEAMAVREEVARGQANQ